MLRDPWAYRLAIGGVGFALVAFLIGGAIIGASGHAKEMVKEYWTIGSALSGALVGILVPSPAERKPPVATPKASVCGLTCEKLLRYSPMLLLIGALAGALVLATKVHPSEADHLRALAAASAGALIGLLSPSPGRNLAAAPVTTSDKPSGSGTRARP